MDFASADLPALLDSVLALLARREAAFAREFFFHGFDVPANLSIITNPASLAHASVTSSLSTMVAPAYAHPAAHQFTPTSMDKAIVLVPCFSASDISVGACIAKAQGDMLGKVGFPLNEMTMGRFVRDERTGETLVISQTVQAGTDSPVIVMCLRHKSSTAHENISVLCRKTPFCEGAMANSVIALCYAMESRNCPVCGKLAIARCHCELRMTPLRHSMDFEAIAQNMATHHHASWTGTASILFRKRPSDSDAALLAFDLLWSHSFVASTDFALLAQLRESIVQRSLVNMAPSRTFITEMETAVSLILASFVDDHVESTSKGTNLLQVESNWEPSKAPQRDQGLISNRWRPDEQVHLADFTGAMSSSRTVASPALREISNERLIKVRLASERPATVNRSPDAEYHAVSTLKIQSEGKFKPNSPDELRALQRRERNRAAAARSNEKRKFRLRKLREDLAKIRLEVADLAEREDALRNENIVLRTKAYATPC
jgi:hypothetical protein